MANATCILQRCAPFTASSHVGPVVGVFERRKRGRSLLRRGEACNLFAAAEGDDNKETRVYKVFLPCKLFVGGTRRYFICTIILCH